MRNKISTSIIYDKNKIRYVNGKETRNSRGKNAIFQLSFTALCYGLYKLTYNEMRTSI